MTTPLRTLDDAFSLARAGNKPAFEQLVIENERLVLRTAWRLLGRREDAQDAAQEVFLRLYKNIVKIRDDSTVEAWLYRVTVNVCQDVRRKIGAQPTGSFVDRGEPATHDQAIEMDQVMAFIAELPDKERAALVLRELEGLSTGEVAAALGSSAATVRSQISSARAKLKAWFGERNNRR